MKAGLCRNSTEEKMMSLNLGWPFGLALCLVIWPARSGSGLVINLVGMGGMDKGKGKGGGKLESGAIKFRL
jgi:hypothetical protein